MKVLFTALFTKPPDALPLYRMGSGGCSVRRFAIDIFPFCRERPVTKEPAALWIGLLVHFEYNSPIHKAASSLVTRRSLQNGKMSMGNRRTERPPDPVLYGGRPSGGFVNSAVKDLNHLVPLQGYFCSKFSTRWTPTLMELHLIDKNTFD